MRQLLYFSAMIITFSGCNKEEAPDCFQTAGRVVSAEIPVEAFDEIVVYNGVRLFVEQGDIHKVVVESGENLIPEIKVEVEEGKLVLRNENTCNLFREYNETKVFVTVPDLSRLQNAGNTAIKGIGNLAFPEIWLQASNQEGIAGIHSIGDFDLQLESQTIRITGDGYSNFFLSGTTSHLKVEIFEGDGRLEAADLAADTVEVRHHGTNKLIVNPQEVLRGEIRSTGDVISVTRPPIVEVEAFYTGRLYFN